MTTCPPVDSRTSAVIAAQVRALFPHYIPEWHGSPGDGATDALVAIFARYCEIVIDRLNRAPEKNLLAFLDLLGAEPLPVQAARVPLTFHLTANARNEVVVPALSQVAAVPPVQTKAALAKADPILFETEQEFTAIPARLNALLVKDAQADRYSDYSLMLEPLVNALQTAGSKITDPIFLQTLAVTLTGKPPAPERLEAFLRDSTVDKRARAVDEYLADGVPLFTGELPIEHSFYVALGAIASQAFNRLTVHIEIGKPAAHPLLLSWSVSVAGQELVLTPSSDGTAGFTKTGDVVFAGVPTVPETPVGPTTNRWLKCRLLEPASAAMPQITRLTVTPEVERTGIPVEKAFLNQSPIDSTKDFYPFGVSPRFGDTLYLGSKAAFSVPGATVTLHIQLTNPASAGDASPLPPVRPQGAKIAWEFWDGSKWSELGISDFGRTAPWPSASFADNTNAFSESGDVTFQFSAPTRPSVLNGQENDWIRARIVFGDYGREATFESSGAKGLLTVPSTLRPPVIHSVECSYRVANTFAPESFIALNDFQYAQGTFPVEPFVPASGSQPFAYFGLSSDTGYFPGRSMNLYLAFAKDPGVAAARSASGASTLSWEYWNGLSWTRSAVRDDTEGFRRSGVIRFVTPSDYSSTTEFGKPRYWWRVHRPAGDKFEPRLRRALLNTVMASNSQTTFGEIIGSSNGTAVQVFRTARKPVLQGQKLEILEPRMPSAEDLGRLLEEEGPGGINRPALATAALAPNAVWVRWHEMPGFTASDSQDRHYVLDHETGGITFGDGVHGKVPPAATNNIRLYRYQTGGGSAGNLPALAISQLKTTVPYVEQAVNFEPSGGGADPEPLASLIERAPRMTRHNFRAVTEQDFEDLALSASPAVAKARCIAGFDLLADPDCARPRGGVASLVIVPRSVAPAPIPDSELLDRIREYLDSRRSNAIDLILVGPEYVRIDVTVELTVDDPAGIADVESTVRNAIQTFLHPVSGGTRGSGWNFGRTPAQSDLYALIEAVPEVGHVRLLLVNQAEGTPGASSRPRFLICGGDIRVTATLDL